MIRDDALSLIDDMLAPLTADTFFAEYLGRAVAVVPGSAEHPRVRLLGPDPRATILAAWQTHPSAFGFHADGVTGPPPPRDTIDGPAAFAALVAEYQARGYTVHVPDLIALSPPLRRFTTALELMLHQPAKASAFWSRPGNRAPVHYDDRDNISIQLVGRKRWYISTAEPSLHNPWRDVAEGPEPLGPHRIVDTAPGDLLFLPRGLRHTVETIEESLHLSITVLPVTVRDAMIAALDHLSDYDRSLRETALGRFDALSTELPDLQTQVIRGLEALTAQCRSPGFVASAIQRRSARIIGDMPKLPAAPPVPLSPASELAHAEGALTMMLATPELIDFALPGTHLLIHRGAEEALRFIANTPRFRLDEIPGLDDPVRIALVTRLLESGYLCAAPES